MPQIDPATLAPRDVYHLLTALVVPRPIAWVSSVAPDGTRNLAPHSYFNMISSDPPILHVTSSGEKDTLRNVRATGEFVVNVVNRALLQQMNLTATPFPADEDEFSWADLAAAPSARVTPPRVAAAPAALECRLRAVLSMGTGNMMFGDVVAVHVDDDVWRDGRVDPARLDAVGRLAGSGYVLPGEIVRVPRLGWDDVRAREGRP